MAQLVGGTRLLAEALDEFGILAQVGSEELERHLPAQQNVLRLVDHTHAALAQLARNAVFAAHQRTRRQLVGDNQNRPVRGTSIVLVGEVRIADGTGLHR